MLRTYTQFVTLRLRWYATSSGRLLLRHWQWLLVAGLVVPGLPIVAILRLPVSMLTMTTARGPTPLAHAAALAIVQSAALLWISPQRRSLEGADFARYFATLPISATIHRSVDLTLLAIADSPFIIAIGFTLAAHAEPAIDAEAFRIGAVLVLLSTVLCAQLAVLEKRPTAFIAVGAADVVLCAGLTMPPGALAWLLLGLATATVIAMPCISFRPPRPPRPASRAASPRRAVAPLRAPGSASTILRIQIKALTAHAVATTTRVTLGLMLSVGADRLIAVFNFDERSLPTLIVAMSAVALALGGIYRTLRNAHRSMDSFMLTLPLPTLFWPCRDVLLVLSLGLAPLVILTAPMLLRGLLTPAAVLGVGLTCCVLVVILRATLRIGARLGVMFAIIVAAGWAGAAIAVVAP